MKPERKSFVFMARSGELVEAYRVTFIDHDGNVEFGQQGFNIGIISHDGWVLYNPNINGGIAIFLNRKSEQLFENLGPL